ncbi:DUF7118 family protein [Salinibaculum rarum]|uniref:DUF7118 family protein n=1 Tax=Salinibaculum rarum TaxID=3058903 RepID=UPI00265FEDF9|nr:hypothetical protein [Salinibaculum sp. KK48]
MSTSKSAADPVDRLRRAADDLERAQQRVDEFGEADLRQLADAYEEFTGILGRYEEPATGDGDFQKFIEFQGRVETFVEELPEDILLREAFEESDDHLQQRRLNESDFEYVREQLSPVADLVDRLTDRESARDEYERARKQVRERRHEVRERIDELERLQRLGEADLTAPTDRLREPIERYDEAVTDAFAEFKRDGSAREVLDFLDRTDVYPLVPFQSPPADLKSYVDSHPPGTESIPKLLELADYSRSKLDHYVDDPTALKQAIATQQTYLRRLDGEPLTVGWPPPTAEELRWQCQELTAVVNRLAPDVVESLRAVRRLPRETAYDRLHDSAVAEAELTDEERERLTSGAVAEELETRREERERLAEAIDEFPER